MTIHTRIHICMRVHKQAYAHVVQVCRGYSAAGRRIWLAVVSPGHAFFFFFFFFSRYSAAGRRIWLAVVSPGHARVHVLAMSSCMSWQWVRGSLMSSCMSWQWVRGSLIRTWCWYVHVYVYYNAYTLYTCTLCSIPWNEIPVPKLNPKS